MAQLQVQNPERYDTKKVDSSGKLYVGREIAGKEVTFIIERVDEMDDDGESGD